MIRLKADSLKATSPREYLARFIFGGLACVLAGLMAKGFGPEIGGLFLAFPAIFPATATLIESHEKKKGGDPAAARREAGAGASGTALGCAGLAAFAWVLGALLPSHNGGLSLAAATAAWAAANLGLWTLAYRGRL